MGQFAGTTFGIGTPIMNPSFQSPWGFSPYAGQQAPMGVGQYGFGQPGINPIHQIAQLLQIVPQQLQQLQFLQQQLAHLQQLLQHVPQQLQQLHYLLQNLPHQLQQPQQWQSPGIPGSIGLGFQQPIVGQSVGHVM